jgi:hypothetical protein
MSSPPTTPRVFHLDNPRRAFIYSSTFSPAAKMVMYVEMKENLSSESTAFLFTCKVLRNLCIQFLKAHGAKMSPPPGGLSSSRHYYFVESPSSTPVRKLYSIRLDVDSPMVDYLLKNLRECGVEDGGCKWVAN